MCKRDNTKWVPKPTYDVPSDQQDFLFLPTDVKFEIDLPKKLVWIESDRDADFLLDTLKKCGKDVKYNGPK